MTKLRKQFRKQMKGNTAGVHRPPTQAEIKEAEATPCWRL
jgi:hypothetical protein